MKIPKPSYLYKTYCIIFERFFALRKVASASEQVRVRIKMALQSQSPEDVEDIARNLESLEGRALNHALKHIKDSGRKGIEELFNTFALSERPELDKFLAFLATVGSNAPYIGLLGTVLGIMKAFQDLVYEVILPSIRQHGTSGVCCFWTFS